MSQPTQSIQPIQLIDVTSAIHPNQIDVTSPKRIDPPSGTQEIWA
jgi:hypothetical protein